MQQKDSNFISRGLRCAGTLYLPDNLPDNVTKPPLVVLGHGLACERAFGLAAFAERFVQQGWAAYTFDYRTLGESAGTPRNWVSHRRHGQDWDAALAHLRGLDEIDATRIALWGMSYGGGHVIAAAARHPDVRAIIGLVPFVDGLGTLPGFGFVKTMKASVAIAADAAKTLFTGKPYYVPVYARPDTFAALNTEESYDGYRSMLPKKDTGWKNEITARTFFTMLMYSPLRRARKVRCAALLQAGKNDSLIPHHLVKKAASRMPKGEFISMDTNHFEPMAEKFEATVTQEITFLKKAFGN